ncbi:bifunctional diaminohydroxyphosphoribosylaminopyrimidine deaminase/5-amino-6-(5-phosphoribosylamino)uracil reductase RibD [Acidaminobacter sp. JC074]|nr:bifunctional diaminohydroxyphosphoribosylaminopyrimidine deaminase/5-amino-6-(5-phosphoribosylamino)uracil reductase RibD [Acidaminobacter sp. JC074]
MKRAIELAKKGRGFVSPNPLVGAVLVRNDQIISEGYHEVYGGNHAEVNAIGQMKDLEDVSLYVTLEPCCHYGKTPPCTELIIRSGIKHVVVATLDPNPLVAGKGVQILRDHGIEVEVGILEDESKIMNEIFNHFIIHKRPFVIMKYAMTLDGKISTLTGDSKWISGDLSRKYVHQVRQIVSGILVGVDTVIKDDPMLNTRLDGKCSHPRPIVLDSRGRIPLTSRLLDRAIVATTELMSESTKRELEDKGAKVLVTKSLDGRVDLEELMIKLGHMNIDSILVEGGGRVHGSFLEKNLVHKVQAFVAPKLLGEGISPIRGLELKKMNEAILLNKVTYYTFGNDLMVEGYIERS